MFKLSKGIVDTINRFFTNAYKAAGFVILLVILVGLASYFVLNAFYLASDRWVAPVILTASHEKVIELNSELAAHLYQRDKLVAERKGLEAGLESQERFRKRFKNSLELEISATDTSRARVLDLLGDFGIARKQAAKTAEGYLEANGDSLEKELEANLINRDQYFASKRNLASTRVETVRLREHQVDLQEDLDALDRRFDALQAVVMGDEGPGGPSTLTYDVLNMQNQYEQSLVETERLQAGVDMIDTAIERYDRLLEQIKDSPYLRAMDARVHLAFVPYDNLDQAKSGTTVYGCKLGLIWCSKVGKVSQVIDGEITARHPLYNEQIRGQMVELKLDDPLWAEEKALFLRRPALIF